MPELDVEHFRRKRELAPEDTSVDAPVRPSVLDAEPIEQEILPPLPKTQAVEVYQPIAQNPIHRLNFEKLDSRREIMQALTPLLPINEFNLPRYIYRADLIDRTALHDAYACAIQRHLSPTISSSEESAPGTDVVNVEALLNNAILHLQYHHGYPTLKDGTPFWARLSYESADSYSAFLRYLELPGARSFTQMPSVHSEQLEEWYHLYYWSFRASAYDMYQNVHHERMRVNRIMRTEDNHYVEAEKLFSRVSKALAEIPDDELAKVEPEKLVAMMEKIARLQRVSTGMPANGGMTEGNQPRPVSVEVQMRQVAKGSGEQNTADIEFDADALLANPEALIAAQELIVKVSGGR